MTQLHHKIAHDFLAGLSAGNLPSDLLTDDMTAWTTTSGANPKERYLGGVRLLGSLFPSGLTYTANAITAEDDRIAIEAQAQGVLSNGEPFQNRYVFILTLREARIATIAEHFNPDPVRQQIIPLMQAAMAKSSG